MTSTLINKYLMKIKYLALCTCLTTSVSYGQAILSTVWGDQYVNNELIEKLLQHNILERLKYIDQSGPLKYFGYVPQFSRYDHSVGVLALLIKAGVSIPEQVAGLLHDTSHTVFSHVGDHLFYKSNLEKSYQDTIHLEFLKEHKIEKIVVPYNITLKQLDPDLHEYSALEKELPALCADRIQYIVHTGVILNKISNLEAKQIIDNLEFQKGQWFFSDKKIAKKMADLSLIFTTELWGAPWNLLIYEQFADMLKHAIKINLVTVADLKNGIDSYIWQKCTSSHDPIIKSKMYDLENLKGSFKIVKYNMGDYNIKPKFRGVDPLVKIKSKFYNLTQLDKSFNYSFNQTKNWCNKGFGIKINK